MDAPPTPRYSKEMVDLLIRIKKHLAAQGRTTIKLSDPGLLETLAAIDQDDDPLLNGMLTYLMALAGPEWNRYYEQSKAGDIPRGDRGPLLDKLTNRRTPAASYRGSALAKKDAKISPGQSPGSPDSPKKTRYYRGQPVSDD